MSVQRLGAKKLRKLERVVGEPILRGMASGGYVFEFITPDHRHGGYDLKTGEFWWVENPSHYYPSCRETWPNDFEETQ